MEIDYNKLRSDLIDYLGTAINCYPMVIVEIEEVQKASDYELEKYEKRYNFDLNNYQKGSRYTRYKII